MTEPRRILFASSLAYPPQFYGGSQSSVLQTCTELNRAGHRAAVLCKLKFNGLLGLDRRVRTKFSNAGHFVDRQSGVEIFRSLDVLGTAQGVVEQFRPDIVVAEAGRTLALARRFVELGLPTLASIRDVEFDRHEGEFFTHARLKYLANSAFTMSRLKEQLDIDASVIHPVVNATRYTTDTTGNYVLHINPHPIKGIDTTLSLARLRPDIRFLVCESWPVARHLRRQLKSRYDDLPNVDYSKPVSDMRKIYAKARCLVVPSQWDEAWGRVVTEAHLSGIPVIARAVGALPETVGPGGILVPASASIDAWADALAELWDEPERHRVLSHAALRYSQRTEISSDTIIVRLIHLIESHLNSCGPGTSGTTFPIA